MKKYFFFLLCLMVSCGVNFGQTSIYYGDDVVSPSNLPIIQPPTVNSVCTGASQTYLNKYRLLQTFIPNSITPIKTIKIAFHFWQKNDGSGNWQNTGVDISRLNQIIAWLNNNHSNNVQPSDPITGVPFIQDTRIRFEAVYYFYQNDVCNFGAYSADFYNLNNQVALVDPSRLEAMPIHITNGSYFGAAGFQTSDGTNVGIVSFAASANPAGDWAFYHHINHEVGHALSLCHTYGPNCAETVDMNNFDYLSDVFSDGDISCSPPPGFACLDYGDWNCDPYQTGNTCTNNMMGATQYSQYLSPMQMGKMHRALAYNLVRRYIKDSPSELQQWVVNSNETWDFDIQMYNDIFVTNGATLTIKCRVGMASMGRIIVDRGARLIIDGGDVHAWGTLWDGTEIWGTYNKKQTISSNGLSPDHGIIRVINGGIIENAFNGITTIKDLNGLGNWDWSFTGGIIQCDGAKFLNNNRAVQYLTYHNRYNNTSTVRWPNIGYIIRSKFETNSLLKHPTVIYPHYFVTLCEVDGIKLLGNIYQNTTSPLPTVDNRGGGIKSVNASFNLSRYAVCSSYSTITGQCATYSTLVPSNFSTLNYAVQSSGTTPVTPINITYNNFTNCNRTAYMAGIYYATISSNNIDVGKDYVANNTNTCLPYGIYFDYCHGYKCQDNVITTTIANNISGTGVYFNGTGGTTNILYRNKIDKMGSGTSVSGDNRGINPGDGLALRCNDYGQNSGLNAYDVAMVNDQTNSNLGLIDQIQGSLPSGTNNTFSHICNTFDNDYYDQHFPPANFPVNYFYNFDGTSRTKPICYGATMSISLATSGNYNFSSMCPVSLTGTNTGGTKSAIQKIASNSTAMNQKLAMIDGGNTQSLLNMISSSMSTGNLRNNLMGKSPYLSDLVLEKFLLRAQTPPPGHIKDIVVANSPVSLYIKNVLNNVSLPNGIRNQINSAQTGSSARTILLADVGALQHEKGNVVDEQIRTLLNDSINPWAQDSLLQLMKADDREDAICKLLATYVSYYMFAKADSLANQIAITNGSLDNFCKLQQILNTLNQTIEKSYKLTSDVQSRQAVEAIANDMTKDGYVNARSLMEQIFLYNYDEYVVLPNSSSSNARQMQFVAEAASTETGAGFSVFPNPAEDQITVSFVLKESFDKLVLKIYDITGKLISSNNIPPENRTLSISTLDIQSGIYFVILESNNSILDKKKLIINR